MVPSTILAPEACGGSGNGEEMKWLTASLGLRGKVETMSKAYIPEVAGGGGCRAINPDISAPRDSIRTVLNYFLVGGDWASDDAEVERGWGGEVEVQEWALVDLNPPPFFRTPIGILKMTP